MNMILRNKTKNILCYITGISLLISALVGFFYTSGGDRFMVKNRYGDFIQLYGDGIYAYNSILDVSNRFGASLIIIIGAVLLIILTIRKTKSDRVELIRTATLLLLCYSSVCLAFGSIDQLYLVNVVCLGASLYASIMSLQDLLAKPIIPIKLKQKRLTGTAVFLIISGIATATVWLSMLVPAIISGNFSSVVGIQTSEATYTLDFCISCPMLILCGVWLLKKRELGYKIAPLLLYVLICIGIMVILQAISAVNMGLTIPIGQLIGTVIFFVILGGISLFLIIRILSQIKT